MKRSLGILGFALLLVVALSPPISAQSGLGNTFDNTIPQKASGVLTDTNCNQAQYYPLGILCQDTDDGKLYKGTGTAVTEVDASIAAGTYAAYATTIPLVTAAGTVDAITANYTPDVTLADKVTVAFRSAGANTSTTPSFAPDGLTAHTIVKNGGVALVAGDIGAAGAIAIVQYDLANTRWELLNPAVTLSKSGAYTDEHVAIFDGTTGGIKDGGVKVTYTGETLATFNWGGGSTVLTTTDTKICKFATFSATLTGLYASTRAESSSDITIALYKDAFAAGAHATTAMISGTNAVVIPAAGTVLNVNDVTLTGFTKTITAGDQICAEITATDTTTLIQLTLYGTR